MSTKTTFKRIALVVVAALGFGTMSAVSPANAVQALSFSLDQTSQTIVGSYSATAGMAVFAVTVTSDTPTVGLSTGESITATVTGVPTAVTTTKTLAANAADLRFFELKQSAVTKVNPIYDGGTVDTFTAIANGSDTNTDGVINSNNTGHYGMDNQLTAAETETERLLKKRTYYMGVQINGAGKTVIDQGVYTIAFDLKDLAGNVIQRTTAKVDWVTSSTTSGAVLTASSTGQWFIGDTMTLAAQTDTRYLSANITNRDGGAVRLFDGSYPVISASITDASTSPVTQSLSVADSDTAIATGQESYPMDGTYDIYTDSTSTMALGNATLTVRYGLASATATVAIAATATASTVGVASIVGAGQIDSTDAATLPLTTKAVTVKYNVKVTTTAQTGYAVYYTLAYGTSCVAGDMSPAKVTTPTKLLTDADGNVSVAITNAYPLHGCTATVTFDGAATDDAAQVITWAKPAAASALPNPGGSYQALLLSKQSVSWTIVDQFGSPVVGASVAITHTGANAPTVAPAVLVSDSSGNVTYTWTDAKGVAASTTLGTDTVKVGTVNAVAPTVSLGSITVTWKSALSTVASIDAYYDLTASTPTTGSKVVVPTTAIGLAAGGRLNSGVDQLDLTKAVTKAASSSTNGMVALQFRNLDAAAAAVSGIPMTITVTNGHIIGADGKLTTSRILYANEALTAVGTKTGVMTVTATTGTLTSSASILWANAATDARVLSLKEAAGTVTATVTDFNGSAVSGVTVNVSLSAGEGRLGNGATYASFTTASDGTVSFDVNGAATVKAAIPTSGTGSSTKTYNLAGYGDTTGTVVTTGAPAGVASTTVTTSGNTVTATAAQTAADAAAEATDAANAATDAANAAAEAADAATAAAQDAADAVAALSAQVASLISGLKSQLTALTNLVIKIQKKVKA
jgi:hypothetical protein